MGKTVDEVLIELAARQHGVAARWQLADAGISPAWIDQRVRRRLLRVVERGVYQVPGLGDARSGEAALVLSFGRRAVASHRSAAALQALLTPAGGVAFAISVAGGHPRRRARVTVHRVMLPLDEVSVADGVPVTSPVRTLLDLGRVIGPRELEQSLASALRLELVREADVLALLRRYPRRPGTGALRKLMVGEDAPAFTRSEAEERFLRLVRRAELPAPVVNGRVRGFEVDFHWRAERVVVEVDGLAYHTSPAAQQRDRHRDTVLASAGIRVLRFTWRDLVAHPEATLARVVMALVRGGPYSM